MSSTVGPVRLQLTRADVMVALSVAVWAVVQLALAAGPSGPGQVVIAAEGGDLGPYDLEHERVLEVAGPRGLTEVVIAAGAVRIAASDCPNQLCVHRGWIRRPGEVSVCVPNRVVLRIVGQRVRGDLDGVSR
ncbi:MAG: NusG domain II-containing protein [Gemmatimonadota bacterium]